MTTKNKVLLLILVAIVAFELLVQIERFSRLNPHPFKKDDTISETSSKYNELRKTLKEIGYEELDYNSYQATDDIYKTYYQSQKDNQYYSFVHILILRNLDEQIEFTIRVEDHTLNLKKPLCIETNVNEMGKFIGIENAYQQISEANSLLRKENETYVYENDNIEILIQKENDKYVYSYTIRQTF